MYNKLMKDKIWKILGGILLVGLFVAVIVTSVLISNKKDATDRIPDVEAVYLVED